ncbi:MAG: hypothetical protein APR53_10525 [Methanoculleus sp. SDB]|nr:MAG: hypothetical protein APR53_10525 [Methanoculleus sp. SDB]
MIRGRAREAVWQILETASFDVEEGDGLIDLSAIRDNECVVVLCSDDNEEIAAFDETRYQFRAGDEKIECIKLLVSFNEQAGTKNLVRWGEEEISEYAGMAAVAGILGLELGIDFGRRTEPKDVQPAPPGVASGPEIPHLPVKVTGEYAVRISGEHGKATCRFIPHWFYSWKSFGEKSFRDRTISFDAGESGAISAINGLPSDIDIADIVEESIDAEADILTPTIQRKEAEEQILEQVIESLTKNVRIKQESGDTISLENKIIRPDRNNITIDLRLVYVPVWQIRGKKIVEINAFNGDILCEPMDDGVEII